MRNFIFTKLVAVVVSLTLFSTVARSDDAGERKARAKVAADAELYKKNCRRVLTRYALLPILVLLNIPVADRVHDEVMEKKAYQDAFDIKIAEVKKEFWDDYSTPQNYLHRFSPELSVAFINGAKKGDFKEIYPSGNEIPSLSDDNVFQGQWEKVADNGSNSLTYEFSMGNHRPTKIDFRGEAKFGLGKYYKHVEVRDIAALRMDLRFNRATQLPESLRYYLIPAKNSFSFGSDVLSVQKGRNLAVPSVPAIGYYERGWRMSSEEKHTDDSVWLDHEIEILDIPLKP